MVVENRDSRYGDDELLTAYLDDELSDSQRIVVESRLADEADLRGQLKKLQQAWDMLDQLPRSTPNVSFTQTTMEMVVQDAKRQGQTWLDRLRGIAIPALVFLLVPLGLAWGAWGVMRYWQDTPNREMVRRLPVIDNVDVYLKAEDVDFLEQLYATGLFSEDDEFIDELVE